MSGDSMDKRLIGRCGLYCGACSIYRGERDDAELRQKIAKSVNCSEEQVRCNGCGDLSSTCRGYGCKIVVCLRAKGLNYCYDCSEYEKKICTKHGKLAQSYLEIGVDLRENLKKIANGLAEEWLKESEARFKCSHCGQPLSAWKETCHKCGSKVSFIY